MEHTELDFSTIEHLDDYEKRVNLIKSWNGQINRCQKKGLKDPYYFSLAEEWQKKIDKCLAGLPLKEVQGKVKVKGKKPMTKKQRVAYKKEQKRKRHEALLAMHQENKRKRLEAQKEVKHD